MNNSNSYVVENPTLAYERVDAYSADEMVENKSELPSSIVNAMAEYPSGQLNSDGCDLVSYSMTGYYLKEGEVYTKVNKTVVIGCAYAKEPASGNWTREVKVLVTNIDELYRLEYAPTAHSGLDSDHGKVEFKTQEQIESDLYIRPTASIKFN
jgi:hypothetical protein